MNRYFIVFYDARNNLNHSIGNCWVHNTDGTYVNNEVVTSSVASMNPKFERRDIVITNIIELNKADYETFTKK